eukprot:Skav208111  [mRNA]  locus=scaffold2016:20462:22671:+ [translate_table: standard]
MQMAADKKEMDQAKVTLAEASEAKATAEADLDGSSKAGAAVGGWIRCESLTRSSQPLPLETILGDVNVAGTTLFVKVVDQAVAQRRSQQSCHRAAEAGELAEVSASPLPLDPGPSIEFDGRRQGPPDERMALVSLRCTRPRSTTARRSWPPPWLAPTSTRRRRRPRGRTSGAAVGFVHEAHYERLEVLVALTAAGADLEASWPRRRPLRPPGRQTSWTVKLHQVASNGPLGLDVAPCGRLDDKLLGL